MEVKLSLQGRLLQQLALSQVSGQQLLTKAKNYNPAMIVMVITQP